MEFLALPSWRLDPSFAWSRCGAAPLEVKPAAAKHPGHDKARNLRRAQILERFSAVPRLVPDRDDHIHAAALRNACGRAGIQIGTIDALLAQLCARDGLTMLSTDQDFENIVRQTSLKVWRPRSR